MAMKPIFAEKLSRLRREAKQSLREAAAGLGVSQALLSHYENGAREPKLEFVVKACDYYGVSADYILGRSEAKHSKMPSAFAEALSELELLSTASTSLLSGLKQMLE
jgi:transcriptional regulator with XRE-family HTH domain